MVLCDQRVHLDVELAEKETTTLGLGLCLLSLKRITMTSFVVNEGKHEPRENGFRL